MESVEDEVIEAEKRAGVVQMTSETIPVARGSRWKSLEAVVDVAAAEASMGVLSTRWRVERVMMRTLSCTHDGDRVESRF